MRMRRSARSRVPHIEHGSPEWNAAVAEILRRDNLEDLETLCRLIGVDDMPARPRSRGARKSPSVTRREKNSD